VFGFPPIGVSWVGRLRSDIALKQLKDGGWQCLKSGSVYNVMLILREVDGGKDRALHIIILYIFYFVYIEPKGVVSNDCGAEEAQNFPK